MKNKAFFAILLILMMASFALAEEDSVEKPLRGVSYETISSLSITFRGRGFSFDCRNGLTDEDADSEVFTTLLTQIFNMKGNRREAFLPVTDPIMTVEIQDIKGSYLMKCYENENQDDMADVICISAKNRFYYTTEAWRVGTILLACEGTRILDTGLN